MPESGKTGGGSGSGSGSGSLCGVSGFWERIQKKRTLLWLAGWFSGRPNQTAKFARKECSATSTDALPCKMYRGWWHGSLPFLHLAMSNDVALSSHPTGRHVPPPYCLLRKETLYCANKTKNPPATSTNHVACRKSTDRFGLRTIDCGRFRRLRTTANGRTAQ